MQLILASGSPYRKALLARTGLPFLVAPADIDESRGPGEDIDAYVARLSLAKARKVAEVHRTALVIGSDQACVLDGEILGKPGHADAAFQQLRRCAGRRLAFRTGLALVGVEKGIEQVHVEAFEVLFRSLSDAEIRHYLALDAPFDCAGSFKIEGAGILLFEETRGRDFNSLIGLPLIALADMLIRAGLNPLLPLPEAQ